MLSFSVYAEDMMRSLLQKYHQSPSALRHSISDVRGNIPNYLAAEFQHPDKVEAIQSHMSRFAAANSQSSGVSNGVGVDKDDQALS